MQVHIPQFEKFTNADGSSNGKRLPVTPNTPIKLTMQVFNDTETVEAYTVCVATGWKKHEHQSPSLIATVGEAETQTQPVPKFCKVLKLFPQKSHDLPIVVEFPLTHLSGHTSLCVAIKGLSENAIFEHRVDVTIAPVPDWSLVVAPQVVRSWRSASFDAEFINRGNTWLRFKVGDQDSEAAAAENRPNIRVEDQESLLRFYVLDPDEKLPVLSLDVPPNGHGKSGRNVVGSKKVVFRTRTSLTQLRFFSGPLPRIVTTTATAVLRPARPKPKGQNVQQETDQPGGSRTATSTFIQKGLIPPWLVGMGTVLTSLLVWSIVFFGGVGRVVDGALERFEPDAVVATSASSCASFDLEAGSLMNGEDAPVTRELRSRLLDETGTGLSDKVVLAFDASEPGVPVACAMSRPDGSYTLAVPPGSFFVGTDAIDAISRPVVNVEQSNVEMPAIVVVADPTMGGGLDMLGSSRTSPNGTPTSPEPADAVIGYITSNGGSSLNIEIPLNQSDFDLTGLAPGSYTLRATLEATTVQTTFGDPPGLANMIPGELGSEQSKFAVVSVPLLVDELGGVDVPTLPRLGHGHGVICGAVTNGLSYVADQTVRITGTGTGGEDFTIENQATTAALVDREPLEDPQLTLKPACSGNASPGFVFGGLPTPAIYTVSTIDAEGRSSSIVVDLSTSALADGVILDVGAPSFTLVGSVLVGDGKEPDVTVTATSGSMTATTFVQYLGRCDTRTAGTRAEKTVSPGADAPCFSFFDLPATGRYTLVFSAPGYRTVVRVVDPPPDGSPGGVVVPLVTMLRIQE